MPKEFLDPAQLQRSDQLYFTHKALSALQDAAKEAIKAHDKYVEALDKLLSTLLDNSDCMEETRKLFGPEGEQSIAPTFEVTGKLSGAFALWKASEGLKKMRADMEALQDDSAMAKRSVKMAEKSSADLEKAAQKAAKLCTDKFQRKIGDGRTSRQRGYQDQQNEAKTQVVVMNNAVVESMLSLAKWWSSKLTTFSNSLYDDYASMAATTMSCFPTASHQPAHTSQQQPGSPSASPHPQPLYQRAYSQHALSSSPTATPPRGAGTSQHVDPTEQSSPSAPSSLVNSNGTRIMAGAAGGGGLATPVPQPAMAPAAPALFAMHRSGGSDARVSSPSRPQDSDHVREAGTAPPAQMAGAPLSFHAPTVVGKGCTP